MPSKKKKYNARFPAGRIKKIMQTDEEVGKVAQAVPIIISRTLELFVESLLKKTLRITNARNAKTLSPSHMKQCIMSENRFDFLRELVKNVPDINLIDEMGVEQSTAQLTTNENIEDEDDDEEDDDDDDDYYNDINRNGYNNNSNINNNNNYKDTTERQNLAHPINITIPLPSTPGSEMGTPVSPPPLFAANFYKEASTSSSTENSLNLINNKQLSFDNNFNNNNKNIKKLSRLESAPGNLYSLNNSKNNKLFIDLSKSNITNHNNNNNNSSNINNSNNNNSNNNDKLKKKDFKRQTSLMQPKQHLEYHSMYPIPSTSKDNTNTNKLLSPLIVKIDVCNQPIVKIDYSNLQLPPTITTTTTTTPNAKPSTQITPQFVNDLNKNTNKRKFPNVVNNNSLQNNLKINISNDEDSDDDSDSNNILPSTSKCIKVEQSLPIKSIQLTNDIKPQTIEMDEDYDNI